MEFLRSFLKRHLAGKPVVVSTRMAGQLFSPASSYIYLTPWLVLPGGIRYLFALRASSDKTAWSPPEKDISDICLCPLDICRMNKLPSFPFSLYHNNWCFFCLDLYTRGCFLKWREMTCWGQEDNWSVLPTLLTVTSDVSIQECHWQPPSVHLWAYWVLERFRFVRTGRPDHCPTSQ